MPFVAHGARARAPRAGAARGRERGARDHARRRRGARIRWCTARRSPCCARPTPRSARAARRRSRPRSPAVRSSSRIAPSRWTYAHRAAAGDDPAHRPRERGRGRARWRRSSCRTRWGRRRWRTRSQPLLARRQRSSARRMLAGLARGARAAGRAGRGGARRAAWRSRWRVSGRATNAPRERGAPAARGSPVRRRAAARPGAHVADPRIVNREPVDALRADGQPVVLVLWHGEMLAAPAGRIADARASRR